jgi:hypothetical protein
MPLSRSIVPTACLRGIVIKQNSGDIVIPLAEFYPLAGGKWMLLFRKRTTSAIDIKIQSAIEINKQFF